MSAARKSAKTTTTQKVAAKTPRTSRAKPAPKARQSKPTAKSPTRMNGKAKPAAPKITAKKPISKKPPPKKTVTQKPALKEAVASKTARPKATRKTAKDAPASRARITADEILGQITRLLMMSPQHRHMFIADLEHRIVPPLRLGQCRVLRNETDQPMAYASWARVSDEVQARLESGERRLKPQDWNSGPHPWLIDIAAPPQALPMVLAELEKTVFKGERVRTLMKRDSGG